MILFIIFMLFVKFAMWDSQREGFRLRPITMENDINYNEGLK